MDGKGRSDWKFVAFKKLLEFWKVRVLILAEQWLIYIHLSKQTSDPHISQWKTSLEMPLLELSWNN